jgi:hypothetical protein
MRRITAIVVAMLITGTLAAQKSSDYTTAENPFQNEYHFDLGHPLTLHVDVQGVRFDSVTVTAASEVTSGTQIRCDVELVGSSVAEHKATITAVLLLEDATGTGLQRLTLDPFRVKSGRSFDEKQRLPVDADHLTGASKVYVFIEVTF